ncbi:hypothetical protein H9L39_20391 [Fusarium oxysporum f. sp. albedinis]|nr:hypothetical protein H9L39_20391 [Fusarium oxysporum f. sp. albedinis]
MSAAAEKSVAMDSGLIAGHSQRIKEAGQILELFNLLRTGSENQALDSLRILRSHNDVESVLNIVKASRSQEQHPRERGWGPISTRHLGLEDELMARNAVTFPPLLAFESNVINPLLVSAIMYWGCNTTSHAAWGIFNWIVFMSLFYQQPGLAYPEYPPVLPIPGFAWHAGRDESANSVRQSLHSAYMGDTFPALCQFWRIIHEVTLRYYRDQPNPRGRLSDHVRLAFAEYKYRELIAWAETLPSSMMRSEQIPHHVLTFHIWFHCAALDILRPFTAQARSAPISLPFKTFSCENSSPDAAYKASVNQLKRLIIVYRKNYAAPIYTMLWHTALIRVANAVLSDAKDSEWHFYLSFCIQCYGSLRRSYRFAEAIGRSLLSMTLQRRDLSVGEARHMLQQFEENRLNSSSEDIRATFMADLNLSMTHPEEASVESLANKFEDIALFREYTSQEGLIADGTMDSDETYAWESQ